MNQEIGSDSNPNLSLDHDNWYLEPSTSLGRQVIVTKISLEEDEFYPREFTDMEKLSMQIYSLRDLLSAAQRKMEDKVNRLPKIIADWMSLLSGEIRSILSMEYKLFAEYSVESLDLLQWVVKQSKEMKKYLVENIETAPVESDSEEVAIPFQEEDSRNYTQNFSVPSGGEEEDASLEWESLIPAIFFEEEINSTTILNSQTRGTSSTVINGFSKFMKDKTEEVIDVHPEMGLNFFSPAELIDREHFQEFFNTHHQQLSIGCCPSQVDYARSLFDRGKHVVITSNCFEKLSGCCGFQSVVGLVKGVVLLIVNNAEIFYRQLFEERPERSRVSFLLVLAGMVNMGEEGTSSVDDAYESDELAIYGVGFKILVDNTRPLFDRGKCATISMSIEVSFLQLDCWYKHVRVLWLIEEAVMRNTRDCYDKLMLQGMSSYGSGSHMWVTLSTVCGFYSAAEIFVRKRAVSISNIMLLARRHITFELYVLVLLRMYFLWAVIDSTYWSGYEGNTYSGCSLSYSNDSYLCFILNGSVFDRGKEFKLTRSVYVESSPTKLLGLMNTVLGNTCFISSQYLAATEIMVYVTQSIPSCCGQLWGSMHQQMKSGSWLGFLAKRKREFVELLTRGSNKNHDASIDCMLTALAPCAWNAYPEAYVMFKHVLFTLIFDKDDQTYPVAREWSEKKKFDTAGLLSSVLRVRLQAFDQIFPITCEPDPSNGSSLDCSINISTVATMTVDRYQQETTEKEANCNTGGASIGEVLMRYYEQNIHDLVLLEQKKTNDLNRLEAQRNDLSSRVRMLREEFQRTQKPGSYVGVVVKVMGKSKVLVKVHPEGRYVVDMDKSIDIIKLTPTTRVALRNDSHVLQLILPSKVDPLFSLMEVENVPDSIYNMIGGLDQQIQEIKEAIELPIKHPELFGNLGIAQPKGVLLYRPLGTGKTWLARAVSHHTDCEYIGEGSRMVRALFVMAREHAPSIIFMDGIDSTGSARMEYWRWNFQLISTWYLERYLLLQLWPLLNGKMQQILVIQPPPMIPLRRIRQLRVRATKSFSKNRNRSVVGAASSSAMPVITCTRASNSAVSFSGQGTTKHTAQRESLRRKVLLTRRLFDRGRGCELIGEVARDRNKKIMVEERDCWLCHDLHKYWEQVWSVPNGPAKNVVVMVMQSMLSTWNKSAGGKHMGSELPAEGLELFLQSRSKAQQMAGFSRRVHPVGECLFECCLIVAGVEATGGSVMDFSTTPITFLYSLVILHPHLLAEVKRSHHKYYKPTELRAGENSQLSLRTRMLLRGVECHDLHRAPPFIEVGDQIIVNTIDDSYITRAEE